MGFAPALWFEEGFDHNPSGPSDDSRGIAGRIQYLFDAIRNPSTGEPYTSAEVARRTLGDLSEVEVEGMKTGAIGDPTEGQVVALAAVFGVEPSYLLDRGEAFFDAELVKGLRNETVREVTRETARLPDQERGLVLGIVRQFAGQEAPRG